MPTMTITCGHPQLNGVFDFELGDLTHRELHILKKITGDPIQGFLEADTDNLLALAVIVLCRQGKITSPTPWKCEETDYLWDLAVGAITFDFEGAGAVDPTSPAVSSGSNGSSGANTEPRSESPENAPSPTGTPV